MKVAVLQSSYIPWKGYFDIINDVDLFIFYDDVQFTKQDWRSRNRIKTGHGLAWLTVPVGADLDRLINEVTIPDARWATKHFKSLSQSYARAPVFADYEPLLKDIYVDRNWTHLSELNQHVIRTIAAEHLGITTEFRDSREFAASGHKLDRLMDLLVKAQATTYVSGPAAQAYIDPERFDAAGIELVYKDYLGYPEYEQVHPPFDHHVSVLDLLFHTGADAVDYIWGWRSRA